MELLDKIINTWNSLEIKQRGVPQKINLKRCRKATPDIIECWNKIIKKYELSDIQYGFNEYIKEIEKRSYDTGGYWSHRFSFYEFLKQSNGLKKFINS